MTSRDLGLGASRPRSKLSALVGANCRARRGKLGLSQAELARNTEVAASHISNLENDKVNPTLGLLVQLADGQCGRE
ncbi:MULTISPECIES: helix-turn-helix domain-containing protein [unclassified Novosphingobium]|uniref:helix-turn-helix domain-containing protein n=1 Tax=unclassified Novosphingobium TaxID=2644732 RepID=UPI0013591E84|nr:MULTISPECIES: helix-turn-helix transcriptional regulator [unclassified Novosphingobium]